MSWPVGADKPETHHAHDDPKRGAAWGALWGVLGGALFTVPVVGGVAGAESAPSPSRQKAPASPRTTWPGSAPRWSKARRRCSLVTEEGNLDRLGERFRGVEHTLHQHQPHRDRARHLDGDLRRGVKLKP